MRGENLHAVENNDFSWSGLMFPRLTILILMDSSSDSIMIDDVATQQTDIK